jgi:glycolate oxidase FAD binding subunit
VAWNKFTRAGAPRFSFSIGISPKRAQRTQSLATLAAENDTIAPATEAEVAEAVRAAYEASRAVFPLGGGTALDFGIAATTPGQTLNLSGLNRIVDYTPRDMTIIVEAGMRLHDLAETLAAEGQHLPIDVPRDGKATIGGVVATNWSGPRRLGHGTIRDYVIGIHAVDGRGTLFKGGGRVVKNVAGYDFCKLLTGSLGTLGVITQLSLKVKPRPECTATVLCECADLSVAESVLNALANLEATPAAIDLLVSKSWGNESANHSSVAIRLEGSESEIAWLTAHVQSAVSTAGGAAARALPAAEADELWRRQIEFSDRGAGEPDDGSPMVMKISLPSSAVADMIGKLLAADENCTIQAHAGNGIIFARFSQFRHDDLTKVLVAKLRPAAVHLGGSLIVVRSKLEGLTSHVVWGCRTDTSVLLEQIKFQFDPRNILNPGRFAYD